MTHATTTKIGKVAPRGLSTLVVAAALLQCGCAASVMDSGSAPTGALQVASASSGTFALAPSACVSGERQLFLGADLLDTARGTTTRLILEPTGEASIRIFRSADPLDRGILFRRADCSRFRLSLDRSGWRVNDIYDVGVSLDVDCRTASGDSLQGTLAAAHCH
ncbi:MAG: hypothetical protein U1F58_08440 [Burkholderiales bacterium]